ncbi:hypothetical protein ABW19_dt0209236 [Dactylella cylindrospora]|nr:hypothetical protein ABW19_dt0209236 [Dactylella cylindrospora]
MADSKQEPLPIKFSLGNNFMASVAAHQNNAADEEIVADADEPSDNCSRNLLNGKLHERILYKKQIVNSHGPHKCDSLLTRAIISDSEPHSAEHSIYSRVGLRTPKRGMSTTSTISTASMPSTADLTSDGSDSSSELSSPSPRTGPVFNIPVGGVEGKSDTVAIKGHSEDELPKAVHPDPNAVVEALGRKRCITFACNTPLMSRQNSDKQAVKIVEPVPKRASTLKFACPFKETKTPKRLASPPPSKVHRSPVLGSAHLNANAHQRRDSAATVVDERNGTTPHKTSPPKSSASSAVSIPRFYEFASSVDSAHSWMNSPQARSRLLKVDCILEKEKQIRMLSEEVDEEAAQEEEQAEEEEAEEYDNIEADEDDEDDGYKEDEEDDEYEIWSDSDDGNRSDDEDGFAESDDEEDFFLQPGTSIPDRQTGRPSCCRNTSDSSLTSDHHPRKRGPSSFQREKRISIRPSTPELPDSTDFVPGTFDEDKPLEDFYLSCMEERKTIGKAVKPQDIDPSFPAEEEDEEEPESPVRVGRRRGSTVRHSSHSRSPRGSPAPNRRFRSPPPMSRRGSRTMSPPPNKRRPSFAARSPPPPSRAGRLRLQFDMNRSSLARSTSLPRHGLGNRKKSYLRATSTSPKPTRAIPFRQRGALDIVKGLERKRMRRREHIYGRKEYKAEAGEGVEKMREIGMMGKERLGANTNAAPKWMISV